MKSTLPRIASTLAILATLSACVVYDPYYPYPAPVAYTAPATGPAAFDRSWNAALGAFADQGVAVTKEDRNAGVIDGRKGGINVKAIVRTQADGRVAVEIESTGTLSQDPGLGQRVSNAYLARTR